MSKQRGIDLRWEAISTREGVKRSVFAWLARTGIGVRSGSRPIGWVQNHNIAALDSIEAAAKRLGVSLSNVCVRKGQVYAGSTRLGSVIDFYNAADVLCRVKGV